ncbi:hypothetical protein L210DRAFT_3557103 [Boletus edulis BED1]|uniref:Transmembrane protein n=1 Tax=Boletus edulis BED1 TaxID=1328754 RepID=A0AAD4BKL3_BOLED|nr:hypothetical protein L210DRAFT_3557103 [Boletus edulis BED1]
MTHATHISSPRTSPLSINPLVHSMSNPSEEPCKWIYFGLIASPASLKSVSHLDELCPRHYQNRIVRLALAQLSVLCICNATLTFRLPWVVHERSLALLSASKILCLVGLLIQLTFHWGSARHIREALEKLEDQLADTRAIMFLATLWFPYLPFVLSVFLLCYGVVH